MTNSHSFKEKAQAIAVCIFLILFYLDIILKQLWDNISLVMIYKELKNNE